MNEVLTSAIAMTELWAKDYLAVDAVHNKQAIA
jgi:hypothetical protein